MSGKVYLVGAGPGDPELITLKALKLLGRASVVLHDALVSAEVLALINPDAKRIDVGKRCGRKLLTQDEINALLIAHAKSHQVVIRLKGGDPSFFGRAGEEIAALREAGIAFEIVPGITAAGSAAAAVGISLTDRRIASQVLFTSIHRGSANRPIQWGGTSCETTVVIYMPGSDYAYIATQLREAGWPEDTPCAIVSNATSSKQQIRTTKLAKLADDGALPSPALMIIGRVVTGETIEAAQEFWINASPRDTADRDAAI